MKALFADNQYIKQEEKQHIGVTLVPVSPIHLFGGKKTGKGIAICLYLRQKENKLILFKKNPHKRHYVYIFHNLIIYSYSAEKRELKDMRKDIKKYKYKTHKKNNTLLINKLQINSSHISSQMRV